MRKHSFHKVSIRHMLGYIVRFGHSKPSEDYTWN